MAKKASFAAASFSNLRAATGEGAGEPLRIALVDIDEDPNQPRKTFDEAELEGLALTIRDKGVLQPIGVLPPTEGRYVLVFGARRFRASKLAGQTDIPAVIVPEGPRDFTTQVIENQQRANLSNSELAAAVNQLNAEGKQGKEIAAICNLRDYQVAAFRAVEKLPDFLLQRLNQGDMRAIYDLYRAWQKQPARVEDAMPDAGTFLTITEARRIIGAVTGAATGSIILDRAQDAQEAPPSTRALASPSVFVPPQPRPGPATKFHTGEAEPEVTDPPKASATTADLHGVNPATPTEAPAEPLAEGPPAAPALAEVPVTAPGVEAEAAAQPLPQPEGGTRPITPKPVPGPMMFLMATAEGVEGVLIATERPETPGCVFLEVDGEWIEASFAGLRGVSTI